MSKGKLKLDTKLERDIKRVAQMEEPIAPSSSEPKVMKDAETPDIPILLPEDPANDGSAADPPEDPPARPALTLDDILADPNVDAARENMMEQYNGLHHEIVVERGRESENILPIALEAKGLTTEARIPDAPLAIQFLASLFRDGNAQLFLNLQKPSSCDAGVRLFEQTAAELTEITEGLKAKRIEELAAKQKQAEEEEAARLKAAKAETLLQQPSPSSAPPPAPPPPPDPPQGETRHPTLDLAKPAPPPDPPKRKRSVTEDKDQETLEDPWKLVKRPPSKENSREGILIRVLIGAVIALIGFVVWLVGFRSPAQTLATPDPAVSASAASLAPSNAPLVMDKAPTTLALKPSASNMSCLTTYPKGRYPMDACILAYVNGIRGSKGDMTCWTQSAKKKQPTDPYVDCEGTPPDGTRDDCYNVAACKIEVP